LRRLLAAILIPPLVIGLALLVLIGLRDFDLLMSITTRLIVVAVIIGIPVMVVRMIISPGRPRN